MVRNISTQLGSANLVPLSLVSVGIKGLNLQAQNQLLDPNWATKASNMVFDSQGRLSSRNGWSALNATPMSGSPTVGQIFEYTPTSGSNQIISTGGNKIYKGTTTLTDITGTLTVTADNWKFVNFNGNVYGLQTGHPLIVYTGAGNFTAVAAATGAVPNGNELLSAFGRLWGSDSTGQVLQYSQLLDATNWSVTGAGSFNLTSLWGNGNDSIVALASFNNYLIVFGARNIIIWADGSGSVLGMNPINMMVQGTVPGLGCIARDTVQNVNGEDVAFLAYSGLQSLQRALQRGSDQIQNLSLNVRDAINLSVRSTTPGSLRSTYNAGNGFYLLLIPSTGQTFVFDTRVTLEDGSWRVTTWESFVPSALYTLHDAFTMYSGLNGKLFSYTGQQDNGGLYICSYTSPWLALSEEASSRIKILKRISSIIAWSGASTLTTRWAYDFSTTTFSAQTALPSITSTAMWGTSQWGTDSWGGGFSLGTFIVPTSSSGQFIQVGLDFTANSSACAFLQTQLYSKIGRVI